MATSTRGDARGGLGHVVFSSDQMWSCRFNWCIYIINKTTYTKTHWIGIISLNFEEYFSSLSSHNLICWCWHLPYGTCLIALYLRLQTSCILASSKSRLRQIPTKSMKSYCWAQFTICKNSRQHILSFVLPWYHLPICTRLRRNGRRKKCKGELGNIVFQEWEKAMYHTWDWNMKGNSCMWLQHKIQQIECQNKPHTSPSAKSCPLDFTGLPKALNSHLTFYVRQAQPGLNLYDWCSCKIWLVNETYCRTPPWLNAVNLN